jgi:ASC-1-like (ASCH) protein
MMGSFSKLVGLGLKPGNCLAFNCPDLKVGAIDVRDIQGFSHINKIFHLFRQGSIMERGTDITVEVDPGLLKNSFGFILTSERSHVLAIFDKHFIPLG